MHRGRSDLESLILIQGRNPFNQNFRAEVRKFLGVKWIATGPKGLVPFHSQNEFRTRAVARVKKLDDDFNGDINDIM